MVRAFFVATLILTLTTADATQHRDPRARAAFVRTQPCPATGKTRGACPGYVVDHIIPLACGGPDAPSNMQWQSVAEAKEKDRTERIGCQ